MYNFFADIAMANNSTTIIELAKDAWTCMDTHSITSKGLFKSDINPLYYSTTILLLQSSLASFMSCIMSALFLPLGVPSMVTQLMAGISLGPIVLGHIKNFHRYIFPPRSYVLFRAYGNFGTILQLFLIGVQTDVAEVFKPGKRGVIIGISVVLLPLALTSLCSFIIGNLVNDVTGQMIGYLAVVGKVQSLTAFPVIADYLIELNILNTEFSNLALCTSMVSGAIGNMVVGDMISNKQATNYSQGAAIAMFITSLILGLGITISLGLMVKWIIKRTPDGRTMKQENLNVIISLVFLAAYLCNQANIQMLLAGFLAGLIVPPGPPLGTVLIEKFSFYNKWMVVPIFYAVHGITMVDIFKGGSRTSFLVVLIILVSFVGKFLGAFVPAVFFNMSYKDASLLGLTMNAQGFLEVILFTHINKQEMISNECLTAMFLSMIITTGASAPLVRYLYKTSLRYKIHNMRTIQHTAPNNELRVLACVYEDENVPPMINVLKATNPTKESPIKLSLIHFVQLVGHTTPLTISHKVHRNLPPAAAVSEPIVNVFKYHEETNKEIFAVHPYTVVSNYQSLHNDVCVFAHNKGTSLIILPYHKSTATGYVNSGIRTVNLYVLDKSPCSVGILIDRGLHNSVKSLFTSWVSFRVAVIFFGGADDREALAYVKRMSEHPAIELTVFHFHPSTENGSDSTERSLDDAMIENFKLETASNNQVRYIEEEVDEGLGVIQVIKPIENEYELILIGRRHDENLPLIIELTDWNKCSELGTIADIFITSCYGGNATLLVIQQQSKLGARSLFRQDDISKATYDVDQNESSFRLES